MASMTVNTQIPQGSSNFTVFYCFHLRCLFKYVSQDGFHPNFIFIYCFTLPTVGLHCIAWAFLTASCGLSCSATCGILVSQPGIEPASPALEGGFLTTGQVPQDDLSYTCERLFNKNKVQTPEKKSFQTLGGAYSVVSNSLQPFGLQPARLLCPWDFSGKNTGVGFHFLLPGIFPSQGSNLSLLHRQSL